MLRKWTTLAVTMSFVATLAVGLALADDPKDSPLHKVMEQVNAENVAITKAVRTPPAFKKSQKDVVVHSEKLIELAKEAREMKDALKKAKDVKEPEKKWTDLMDAFTKQCENLATVAGKPSTTQAQAKSAHGLVKQSCTDCHNVFRIEEEGDFK